MKVNKIFKANRQHNINLLKKNNQEKLVLIQRIINRNA